MKQTRGEEGGGGGDTVTGTILDTGRERYLSGTHALRRRENVPACAVSGERDKGNNPAFRTSSHVVVYERL